MNVIVRLRRCDEAPPVAVKKSSSSVLVSADRDGIRGASPATDYSGFAAVIDGEGPNSDQREVYHRVASRAVHSVATGLSDACVLVYGQTGAGKTRTVFGDPGFWRGRIDSAKTDDAASAGILPRSVGVMFRILAEDSCRSPEIFISCAELYQGQIRDLLFPERKPRLLGNRAGSHSLVDIGWLRITNTTGFCDSVRRCASHRMTSATTGNSLSSRSHCFFYIKVGARTLTIVDLAGSERLAKHGSSQAAHRITETKTINLSLSWLSHCFKAVSDGQKPPVRESALTRLLHGAIVGDQPVAVCLCITDRPRDLEETRGTLAFGKLAQRAGAEEGAIEEYVSTKLEPPDEREEVNVARLQAYVKHLRRLCSGTDEDFRKALRADVELLKEGITVEELETSSVSSAGDSDSPAVFSVRNAAERILSRLNERAAPKDPVELLKKDITSDEDDLKTCRVSNSVKTVTSLAHRKRLNESTPETARTRSTAADEKHCFNPCYELLSAG
ncbi:hypothetical protein FOZ60_003223 [Perkinsus olseni]|uniref:Kinesin motor domain-containing protein n=1 Tax=Perkinsus olseni TaxID=32597 RepID=A0A7J6NWY4_PEROL|nr:hypothetical protein FOZ60_003223 [Perkinsus olseni]